MDNVTLLAWKLRGVLIPAGDSVRPVWPVRVDELQGTTVDVDNVDVLQKGAPEDRPRRSHRSYNPPSKSIRDGESMQDSHKGTDTQIAWSR